jgi:hypothetical protein
VHLALVASTPEAISYDYSRAAQVIRHKYEEGTICLLALVKMMKYLELLESDGHRSIYLNLTNVALLSLSSRGEHCRRALHIFYDKILEVLPRECHEVTENKILSEIDISS